MNTVELERHKLFANYLQSVLSVRMSDELFSYRCLLYVNRPVCDTVSCSLNYSIRHCQICCVFCVCVSWRRPRVRTSKYVSIQGTSIHTLQNFVYSHEGQHLSVRFDKISPVVPNQLLDTVTSHLHSSLVHSFYYDMIYDMV